MQVIQILVIFCVPQIYGLVLNSRERSHVPLPRIPRAFGGHDEVEMADGGEGTEDRLALAPRCLQHTWSLGSEHAAPTLSTKTVLSSRDTLAF